MDKDVMKRLLRDADIPVARFLVFHAWEKIDTEKVEAELGFPCFVKPANLGSSVGISKVSMREELDRAIHEAFRYDRKILIEEAIV
jgi:D-alanine-D-alanine ligase